MARNRSGQMCFFLPLRDFGMCLGAGDQCQEELAIHLGHVVAVDRLACGVADGRAVHHGTTHWVMLALVLGNVLGKRKKRRRWRERRRRRRKGRRRRRRKRSRRTRIKRSKSCSRRTKGIRRRRRKRKRRTKIRRKSKIREEEKEEKEDEEDNDEEKELEK